MGDLTGLTTDREGWLWPKADTLTFPTVIKELAEIPDLLALCKRKDICVQAGGNGGLWVRPLAEAFGKVLTFEPDPLNFRCLVHNVPLDNVTFTQGALGSVGGQWCKTLIHKGNPGATKVKYGAGEVPVYAIDELMLPGLDLLQLDIEGAELHALKGAVSTITAFKPVICVELRGHSGSFGNDDEAVRRFLRSLGYERERRVNFDEFWTPS
jgi:FkbM family methyltransferase